MDQHPILKPEHLFTVLAGGKKFSKLDLSQAYQQMVLDPSDRKYTTINTHLGLFQYTRLPFGIASARQLFFNSKWKRYCQSCLLPRWCVNNGQWWHRSFSYFTESFVSTWPMGATVKKKQMLLHGNTWDILLMQKGYTQPQTKSKPLSKPQDPQLWAFLGLVNCYSKFLPALSTTAHPLNQLFRKQHKWQWSTECETVFSKLKEQ